MYVNKSERKFVEDIVNEYRNFAEGIDKNLLLFNVQLLRNMLKVFHRIDKDGEDLNFVLNFIHNTNGCGNKLMASFDKHCCAKEPDRYLRDENENLYCYFHDVYFSKEDDPFLETVSLVLFFEELTDSRKNSCTLRELVEKETSEGTEN